MFCSPSTWASNGVRKHQKIEDPRYLYWADVLGLLVWEEMPSAYRFTSQAVERLTREWGAASRRDRSHPSVVAWVPINESWGVPDLTDIAAQRHFVQALYHLTRTLDSERPVVGNDGWEALATDIIGIHDYDTDLSRIATRYASTEVIPRLFRAERPGGRTLTIEGHAHAGQPIMLTEFGGIAFAADPEHTWDYSRVETQDAFRKRISAPDRACCFAAAVGRLLLDAVRRHVSRGKWTAVCRPHAQTAPG